MRARSGTKEWPAVYDVPALPQKAIGHGNKGHRAVCYG